MTYAEFETLRWPESGGAELANYARFIDNLCSLVGAPKPDVKTDQKVGYRGLELGGSGFVIESGKAQSLGLKTVLGLDKYIRPYRNGKNLTASPRGVYVIDLFELHSEEVLTKFPYVYQHLLETVKPEREQNRDPKLRENWWLHRRSRVEYKEAVKNLARYIVSPCVAKHSFFVFLDTQIAPDDKVVAIASDDALLLGLLLSIYNIICFFD